jgi:hypothetical protein
MSHELAASIESWISCPNQNEQNLQATVQRIESYVRVLEDKVETSSKKK